MKTITVEIPEGKRAEWVNGVLTLVDDKPVELKFKVGDRVKIKRVNQVQTITSIALLNGNPVYKTDGNSTLTEEQIELYAEPKDITERIKTFEDAIKELGDEHEYVKTLRLYEEQMHGNFNLMSDIYAYMKLRVIVAALNEDWEPDFCNESEYKYWGWMYTLTEDEYNRLDENEKKERTCRCVGRSHCYAFAYGVLVCAYAVNVSSFSRANFGSRLAFKSRELALYAVKQFKDIYMDFCYKGKK